jgi:hypothetical protein
MVDLHPEAHALTVFRIVKDEGRNYTATWFPKDPWAGCDQFLRQCHAVGWIKPTAADEDCYAVLDVLNENGDIVQDFPIRDAKAFQQIKRRLHLAVERIEDWRDETDVGARAAVTASVEFSPQQAPAAKRERGGAHVR